ncbi:PLD nuclease N-terminal domain-containing protein [Nesterenkonia natronophila]|uniref:PLDc_N domain-containing protein n=1 Tax=Nesterenkonia natronophila TaxID=2174932 RepID=A0A3A4EZI3_9MICC|nr:PLD nuclease N-terminal domain-containing protein [Nesterenkonia natronophila]RJN31303.1 PLDc_N domain-containing protein [Nesterenkonia natronophila]
MFDLSEFWSVVWAFFWVFAFIAYLIALFSVISDLFRDHKLNGWGKAAWTLFLIFVPFLTVLVYLVARGPGMQERAATRSKQAEDAIDDRIRKVTQQHSPAAEIAQAQTLASAGTITAQEFEAIKKHALARSS